MSAGRRLDLFTTAGYDKGRSLPWQVAWFAVSHLVFQKWWCPSRVRPAILRAFGATVGHGVNIRNGVRVHWPWKLTVGDHVWLGEGAWVLNLEPVLLGDHVCVSQEALLCTGGHDRRAADFRYDNGPITVGDGAWVAVRATVLRGIDVPAGTTVPAGRVARSAADCLA